ncbi:hypothetical protein P0D68_03265 [Paraburkholderia sp. RL17-380-BIE-A]|uniref:hypothetical protein n=1 Tax=Paraburkholderia sp. RL17-380-BIE-A TaxID=3031630 RepID=UPI0038BC978A
MTKITATGAGGMTTAATADGNTIAILTMTTDSPTAAPGLALNAQPFSVTLTTFESHCTRCALLASTHAVTTRGLVVNIRYPGA